MAECGYVEGFAAGTVANLQNKAETEIEADGHTGLFAYVRKSSHLETASQQFRTNDLGGRPVALPFVSSFAPLPDS